MPNRLTVTADTDSITGKNIASGTSTTLAVTIADNDYRISVLVNCGRGTNDYASSVTRDGESYTLAKRSTRYDNCFVEIWYLTNPNADTGNINVSFNGTNAGRGILGHIALYNVDVDDPVNLTAEGGANASSYIEYFTATEDNCIAVEGQWNTGTTSGSPRSGQTALKTRSGEDSGGCSVEGNIDAQQESVGWTGFQNSTTAHSHAVVVFQGEMQAWEPNVSDTISVTDSATTDVRLMPVMSESIAVTESFKNNLVALINEEENASLAENTVNTIREGHSISIWKEDIFVSDVPDFPGPRDYLPTDSATVSEDVTVKIQDPTSSSHKPILKVKF